MFADPQSITIDGVANSLPRVANLDSGATYQKDDANVKLLITHTTGRRSRHTVRLDHRKIAADPFQGSVNAQYSMSAYLVLDVPIIGYALTDAQKVVAGLTAWTTASSGANIAKLLGGES